MMWRVSLLWLVASCGLQYSQAFVERRGSNTPDVRGGSSNDLPEVVPHCDVPNEWAEGPKRGLVFMDKFCPYFGFYMSRRACDWYGVAAINVFSDYMKGYFLKEHPGQLEPLTMCIPDDVKQWVSQLPVDEIVGIICESDSGLADAEKFGVQLKVKHHDGINEARRNKFLMIQEVGKAGLAVVKQKLCHSVKEARDFAKELGLGQEVSEENDSGSIETTVKDEETTGNSGTLGMGRNTPSITKNPMCIVKPIRGSGSDSVFLCKDLKEVEEAFDAIFGSGIFGSPRETHDSVLVQEFASGTEYALDIVSKAGEHKVAALWRYDKRPANGAPFVYHVTELVDADTPVGKKVCEYAKKALDALGIRWGLTHSEVIVGGRDSVPRLVEVNCRQHNMDFAPLTMACIGYNAFDMTLAAYLGGLEESAYPRAGDGMRLNWDNLPDLGVTRAYGAVVHLVNFVDGELLGLNGEALEEIEAMESVMAMEIYPPFLEIGSRIAPTVDIRTDAGWVHIVNDDREKFQRDYERIVELMPTLFNVKKGK